MNDLVAQLETIQPAALRGSVARTEGVATAVAGLPAAVGAIVEIQRAAGHRSRAKSLASVMI